MTIDWEKREKRTAGIANPTWRAINALAMGRAAARPDATANPWIDVTRSPATASTVPSRSASAMRGEHSPGGQRARTAIPRREGLESRRIGGGEHDRRDPHPLRRLSFRGGIGKAGSPDVQGRRTVDADLRARFRLYRARP